VKLFVKKRVVQNFLTCWRIRHKRCSNCWM